MMAVNAVGNLVWDNSREEEEEDEEEEEVKLAG